MLSLSKTANGEPSEPALYPIPILLVPAPTMYNELNPIPILLLPVVTPQELLPTPDNLLRFYNKASQHCRRL